MIIKGKITRPQKVLIYGVEGIGKSSLAAQFPSPVFLDTEDRTAGLDVDRIICRDFATFRQGMREVADSSEYRTIVIDTVDWLEKVISQHLVISDGKQSIEDFGYGKGYKKIAETFQEIIQELEAMQTANLMHIVMVAHSKMKKFDCPITNASYDRYSLNCHEGISSAAKEWCDAVLFINTDPGVFKDADKKTKANDGRTRMVYSERCAAYDAKNSWKLPASFELDYKVIAPHIGAFAAPVNEAKVKRKIRDEVLKLAEPIGGADGVKKELAGKKFLDMTLAQCEGFLEVVKIEVANDAAIKENK